MCAFWRTKNERAVAVDSAPEPVSPDSLSFQIDPLPVPDAPPVQVLQSVIGKDLVVKGEITGAESLVVDGRVEGVINLPGNRVTIGPGGKVTATMAESILARDIIVIGKVQGNVAASDLLEIRVGGELIGDVVAARISIEDGADFRGNIEIRKPRGVADTAPAREVSGPEEEPSSSLLFAEPAHA